MRGKLLVLRVLALLAIVGSSVALVDYLRPEPLFCGLRSGCESVVQSDYGRPAGIPLPFIGLAAFAAFYLLTLVRSNRMLGLLDTAAVVAGFVGIGLILVQFVVLGQICQVCLFIDGCAMLLALVALAWPSRDKVTRWQGGKVTEEVQPAFCHRVTLSPCHLVFLWVGVLVLALVLPPIAAYFRPAPPLPAEVLDYQHPDRLTVVFVTDFSCQHCRLTHPALREALADCEVPVHLVMLIYPRPDQPHAKDAARAYYCAAQQNKGAEMADALFALANPTAEECERVAAELGLDLSRYRTCLGSPETEAKLDQSKWIESSGVKGLPAIWIGKRRLTGLQTADDLRAALLRAGQTN